MMIREVAFQFYDPIQLMEQKKNGTRKNNQIKFLIENERKTKNMGPSMRGTYVITRVL